MSIIRSGKHGLTDHLNGNGVDGVTLRFVRLIDSALPVAECLLADARREPLKDGITKTPIVPMFDFRHKFLKRCHFFVFFSVIPYASASSSMLSPPKSLMVRVMNCFIVIESSRLMPYWSQNCLRPNSHDPVRML